MQVSTAMMMTLTKPSEAVVTTSFGNMKDDKWCPEICLLMGVKLKSGASRTVAALYLDPQEARYLAARLIADATRTEAIQAQQTADHSIGAESLYLDLRGNANTVVVRFKDSQGPWAFKESGPWMVYYNGGMGLYNRATEAEMLIIKEVFRLWLADTGEKSLSKIDT